MTTSPSVQAPYNTYSSATDSPAGFGQSGTEFGISGAGADLYSGSDAYSRIYQPGAPTGSFSTVGARTLSLPLSTGTNTFELSNPNAYAPDFNEIIVAPGPS